MISKKIILIKMIINSKKFERKIIYLIQENKHTEASKLTKRLEKMDRKIALYLNKNFKEIKKEI